MSPQSDKPSSLLAAGMLLIGTVMAATGSFIGRREPPPPTDPFGNVRSAAEPLALQHARAKERARGRRAVTPRRIPWRGWVDIVLRTFAGIGNHRLNELAAGVAFYELLAIFPALTALVSIYGVFASSIEIRRDLALLALIVPASTLDLIGAQIDRIAGAGGGRLTLTFVGSLALSLWSANAGVKALFDALNVIYDEDEKRSIVRLNAVSLGFTFGVIGFLLTCIAAIVAVPAARGQLVVLRWPLLLIAAMLGLSILYRFGPSRRAPKWRWVTLGSVASALVWLAGSAAFSFYLAKFPYYDVIFGSLGAAVGFMLWLWLSAIVVLLGAQLNAEVEHQTARDSTVGDTERPLGDRGAVMADTVGAAQT